MEHPPEAGFGRRSGDRTPGCRAGESHAPKLTTGGPRSRGTTASWAQAVRDYFDGKIHALDDIPAAQPGTPTRQRLYTALRAVPAGTTVSYARLAEMAGLPRTAARAAGQACAQNLIAPFVPCHRVLPSGGGFGGYYYGPNVKQWLLAHESQH